LVSTKILKTVFNIDEIGILSLFQKNHVTLKTGVMIFCHHRNKLHLKKKNIKIENRKKIYCYAVLLYYINTALVSLFKNISIKKI